MALALVTRTTRTDSDQHLELTFERFPIRIGRNQLNDLHIDPPSISQSHATVDVRDRRIVVRDLGSTNGTIVNGKRLARDTPVDITATPEITVGAFVIRFTLEG